MPIIRGKKALAYFSHIPKTGGSAVEHYVRRAHPGSLGFINQAHGSDPDLKEWSDSSPQHIPGEVAGRFFPSGFFDVCFATTRHPVDRFLSAFRYQKHLKHSIPESTSLEEFVGGLTRADIDTPGRSDNHFLAAHHLLLPASEPRVFKLEQGLDLLQEWLDTEVFGGITDKIIDVRNSFAQHAPDQPRDLVASPAVIEKIENLYEADFKRFGYEPGDHRAIVRR